MDLVDLAKVPEFEIIVEALLKFYDSIEKLRVSKERCKQLGGKWTRLLHALRDNSDNLDLVESDYVKIHDYIDSMSTKVLTWSTWSGPGTLSLQLEIGKGLEEFDADLMRCALHFKMSKSISDLETDYMDAFNRFSDLCLDGRITIQGGYAVAGGGYADVSQGTFEGRTVAIKVLRLFSSGRRIQQSKLLRRLWREYLVWSSLTHPNVLECLGFSYDFSPESYLVPSLISPWMSKGTVPSYLENYPDTDRISLLLGVAEGLSYLHTCKPAIVHRDLRAGNVLVSDLGVPRLSDFGLSRVLADTWGVTTSGDLAGSLRWASPELLQANNDVSVKSDIWAYGMTVLEILSGDRPYSAFKNDLFVFGQIKDGQTPSRPTDPLVINVFSDEIWTICQQCWCLEPTRRPSMPEVTSQLRGYWNLKRYERPSCSPSLSAAPPGDGRSSISLRTPPSINSSNASGSSNYFSASSRIAGSRPPSPSSVRNFVLGFDHSSSGDATLSYTRQPAGSAEHALSPILNAVKREISGRTSAYNLERVSSPISSVREDAPSREPVYIKYRSDNTVEAGTFLGLVERLILDQEDLKDMYFREIFLTSYQAFTNAEDLFNALVERFDAVSSPEHRTEKWAGVRLSVLTVLELWLRIHHWEPKDVHLLHRMSEFGVAIRNSLSVPAFREAAERIRELIDSTRSLILSPSLTPTSSSLRLRSSVRPSEISPQDLALALTVLEGDRYRKIIPSDFIGWLKGIHESNGVSSFVDENEKLSYWVQRSILRPDDQNQRASNLKYFLIVAEECRKLRNFSSTCALFAGISSPSITGLKRTSTVDRFCAKVLQEAEKLMSADPDKRFAAYWTALDASRAPCVPWLNVHLHDIKTIYGSQPTFIKQSDPSGVINFDLYRHIHEKIRRVLFYQDRPHTVTGDRTASIQGFVKGQLRSLVVDHEWLQNRAAQLARKEKEEDAVLRQELMTVGFAPKHKQVLMAAGFTPKHRQELMATRFTQATGITPPPNSPLASLALPRTATQLGFQQALDSTSSLSGYDNPFHLNSKASLNGHITRLRRCPVALGGCADIWEGLLGDQRVAVKIIRLPPAAPRTTNQLLRRLWREFSPWSDLSHPNVFEYLGFSSDFTPESAVFPSLVLPWMTNGTVVEYLEKFQDADRWELLASVAEGLYHLHAYEPSIVHGDLKAGNILVSDSGVPRLQFGFSRILQNEEVPASSSLRWMSPELLHADSRISMNSDVWAYGMTVLEVLSGEHPYYELKNDAVVFGHLGHGRTPSRPQDLTALTDEIWAICEQCWVVKPAHRPSMQEVISRFPGPHAQDAVL